MRVPLAILFGLSAIATPGGLAEPDLALHADNNPESAPVQATHEASCVGRSCKGACQIVMADFSSVLAPRLTSTASRSGSSPVPAVRRKFEPRLHPRVTSPVRKTECTDHLPETA